MKFMAQHPLRLKPEAKQSSNERNVANGVKVTMLFLAKIKLVLTRFREHLTPRVNCIMHFTRIHIEAYNITNHILAVIANLSMILVWLVLANSSGNVPGRLKLAVSSSALT